MSDIRFTKCPENCVGNGMAEHVGIRVTIQSPFMRNFHPAETQRSVVGKAMHIISNSYHGRSTAKHVAD